MHLSVAGILTVRAGDHRMQRAIRCVVHPRVSHRSRCKTPNGSVIYHATIVALDPEAEQGGKLVWLLLTAHVFLPQQVTLLQAKQKPPALARAASAMSFEDAKLGKLGRPLARYQIADGTATTRPSVASADGASPYGLHGNSRSAPSNDGPASGPWARTTGSR